MLPQNFNLDEFKDWQKMLVLTGSVLISETLSTPFEKTKVALQLKPPSPIQSFLQRKEIKTLVRDVKKQGGWRALYQGFKPSLDHQIFLNTTRFYMYYLTMDDLFKNRKHEFSFLQVFISTVFATTVGTFFGQASDISRLRIQGNDLDSRNKKKMDPIMKMRRVLQYRKQTGAILPGVQINLFKENLQAVIEVFTFFGIKKVLMKEKITGHISNIIAVFAATGLGTLVSTPLDIIYTRTVLKTLNGEKVSAMKCLTELVKKEGVRGLYKSYIPYFFRAIVFNLSMVTSLELFCRAFQVDRSLEKQQIVSSPAQPNFDDLTDMMDRDSDGLKITKK